MEQQLREWMGNRLQDVWEDCVRASVELYVKLQELREEDAEGAVGCLG